MPVRPKRDRLEKELEALRPALADPESWASREILRSALHGSKSFVAAKAAGVIRDRLVGGLESELKAALDRFMKDPVKTDPGCNAKLAVLEALDYLECLDTTPFLTAIRHFQLEPSWGSRVDTACGLRARGALGLSRQGHSDFMLLMADLLADPEAPVRQAAAEALAHRADPAGAGLLQLKIRVGDPEPTVILACLAGLLSLAPEWGLGKAKTHLEGGDEELREVAALALGQSRREDALELLLAARSNELLARRRAVLLRALGMHRSDRALAELLEIIAEGNLADAKIAVESLSFRSHEPGLTERVRDAAARNRKADLSDAIHTAFRTPGD